MENETELEGDFKFEDCRAQHRVGDLIDCLSSAQAKFCRYSLPFGFTFFCRHPRRNEIIGHTRNEQNKISPTLGVGPLTNQEEAKEE
jgi:hypothetical protein